MIKRAEGKTLKGREMSNDKERRRKGEQGKEVMLHASLLQKCLTLPCMTTLSC